MKILFLSILFLSTSHFTISAAEEIYIESHFSNYQLIEQECGGQLVASPEIQNYVNQLAATQGVRACTVLDDARVDAWVFSTGQMAITRGLLFEIDNEEELKKLIEKGAHSGCEVKKLTLERVISGQSSDEFKELFTQFKAKQEVYAKLHEGYQACEMGEYEHALCLAEDLLGSIPDEPHLLGLLARCSSGMGNCPGALLELKKALRLNPDYYDFYLQRGLLFMKLGVPEGARFDFEESLKLYPSEQALMALGLLNLKQGRYQEAVDYLSKVKSEEAGIYLKMAEVMLNPNEHLDLTLSLNHHGYLMITAKNTTHFDMNRLVVSLNSNQRIKFGDHVIKPNQSYTSITEIGPFDRHVNLSKDIDLSVVSVKVNIT